MNKYKWHQVIVFTLFNLVCFAGFATPVVPPPDVQDEQSLRTFEERLLGPEHAAEHARARAQAQARAHIRAHDQETQAVFRGGTLDQLKNFLRRFVGNDRASNNAFARLLGDLIGPAHATVGSPDQVGAWSPSISIPVIGIHATLLPSGKVLFWNYKAPKGVQNATTGVAYIWNPGDGTGRRIDPPGNLWCAGQALLADGRLLVAGGNLAYANATSTVKGLNQIYIFNPFNETWIRQPDMRHGRWYPTLTTLPDGRVLITSGLDENGNSTINSDIEVFTPSAELNGVGAIQLVGARAIYGLYPHQFLLPNGRVIMAGPNRVDSAILNPADWTWSDIPNMKLARYGYGSGVLMPDGPNGSNKVMLIGGTSGGVVTATNEIFNAANPAAGWQYAAPLPQPRRNTNTVILPDGKLLTVGGNNSAENYTNPQFEPQLYDPATNTWTPLASQVEPRGYHSTALLLPDGRVLSAGDDGAPYSSPRFVNDAIEIFSPPYLFRGARPVISSAPATITWGQTFTIGTPSGVTKAVLIAPGATTHGNDMNQRYVPLVINPVSGGVDAVAPPNANVAPPGYYMLFLLNAQGVPSVAKWVRVGGGGTVQLSASAYGISEAAGSATITVTRSGTGAVSVNYATGNGSAVAGSDYTTASGVLNWAADDTAPKTFSVPITNDTTVEGDETVAITLSAAVGATLGNPSGAVLTILDDDTAPPPPSSDTVQFQSAVSYINEGAGTATITVTRSGAGGGPVTVNYVSSNGTAVAPADYTAVSGALSWAAGDYASKSFTVPIVDDALVEPNESINLALSDPSGASLGTQSGAQLYIANNDVYFNLSASSYSVNETAGSVTITVYRSGGSPGAFSVDYATGNGSAQAGADYTAVSGTLTWASGQYGGKTFVIPILDDTLPEPQETVNIALSNPTNGAKLGTVSSAVLNIFSNE